MFSDNSDLNVVHSNLFRMPSFLYLYEASRKGRQGASKKQLVVVVTGVFARNHRRHVSDNKTVVSILL